MKVLPIYLTLSVILLFLLGCEGGEREVPEDKIRPERMEEILLDFHVAEAISGKGGGPVSRRSMLREDLQIEILERYGLDKETFFDSYQYYLEHPVLLDSIYSRLIRTLEERSDEEEAKDPPSKMDSIAPGLIKRTVPEKSQTSE